MAPEPLPVPTVPAPPIVPVPPSVPETASTAPVPAPDPLVLSTKSAPPLITVPQMYVFALLKISLPCRVFLMEPPVPSVTPPFSEITPARLCPGCYYLHLGCC